MTGSALTISRRRSAIWVACCIVEPGRAIDRSERLVLVNLRDRAQQPNVAPELTVALEPPLWPSNESELAFLWQTADAANLVRDREGGVDRAPTLEAVGREGRVTAHLISVSEIVIRVEWD